MDNGKERNNLYDIIITNNKIFYIVFGIMLLGVTVIISILGNSGDGKIHYGWEILANLSGQIGSVLVSIGLVDIAYQQWKEKKTSSDQYYLMTDLEFSGNELKKYDFFRDYPKKKIMPIVRRENLEDGAYKFSNILNNNMHHLIGKTVFVYGTTLGFLNDGNKKNKKAFTDAVINGVNFNLAILDPHINRKKDKIPRKNGDKSYVNTLIQIIDQIISENNKSNKAIGMIELRLTQSLSSNSFSSFEFVSGKKYRTIRVLDFNFKKEEDGDWISDKLSQIFDNLHMNKQDADEDTSLSKRLFDQYQGLYKRSVVELCFNPVNTNFIIYVCGIDIDTKKIILINTDKEPQIPQVKIDENNVDTSNSSITKKVKNEYLESTKTNIQLKGSVPFTEEKKNVFFFIGITSNIEDNEEIKEYRHDDDMIQRKLNLIKLDYEQFEEAYYNLL